MHMFSFNLRLLSASVYLLLTVISVTVIFACERFVDPHEDAAILFRYSINLSNHIAISYNPGGSPAEGATDFLYMVAISVFTAFGIDAFQASLILNLLGLIASVQILRNLFDLTNTELIAVFLTHLVIPSAFAAYVGFSVFVFEAALLACVYCVFRDRIMLFFLSILMTCLIRPDGLFFCAALTVWMLWKHRDDGAPRALLICLIAPGLAYFALRWWYFSEFLPLPFYVKSDAARDVLGLFVMESIMSGFAAIVPSLIALPLALQWALTGRTDVEKKLAVLVSMALIPFLLYATFRLEQNISNRFFHFIPVMAFVMIADIPVRNQLRLYAFVTVGLAFFLAEPFHGYRLKAQLTSIEIGQGLAGLNHDLHLAVTEAGHIPLHSKAETVDLWGLNTPRFARVPADGAFVRENGFDLVLLHAPGTYTCDSMLNRWATQYDAQTATVSRNWADMVNSLLSGIDPAGYALFAVPFHADQSNRFDMYFVNKMSEAAPDVSNVLLENSALPCEPR